MKNQNAHLPIILLQSLLFLHHQLLWVINTQHKQHTMPSRPFPPTNPTKTKALFLALTISACVVIFCSILYFLYHLWHSLVHRAKTIPFDASAPLKLQRFSYKDLKQATNGFDTANVIGKGGSGTVFRGILKDGKLIAIKRLDTLSLQSEREFQNELQILGGLRSPFLVTLLGYCVEKNRRVLVYEYIPNRSLQESLFGDEGMSLSWESRLCIILDVARALEFLHLGCDPPVIHGDIKPSNVLIDSEWRGKISDFGLSRIKVEGEFGLTWLPKTWDSWLIHLAQADNILELVDGRLKEDYNKDQASLCINLALICLQKIPEL